MRSTKQRRHSTSGDAPTALRGRTAATPEIGREREWKFLYADTIETLTAFMQEQGISQRDLARRLGRSEPWISRILNGRENTTLKTVAELAWGLGLRLRVAPEPLELGDDLGISSNWVLKQGRQPVRTVRQQPEKGAEMAKKPAVVTGPHPGGGWQNKVEGNSRASNVSSTKAEAQAKGRQMAIDRHTEHKIQNKDGKIAQRNSYGHDPYPPKGSDAGSVSRASVSCVRARRSLK